MIDTRKCTEVKCGLGQVQNTFPSGEMLKKNPKSPTLQTITNTIYFLSFGGESATIHPQTIWRPQCVGQITTGKGSLGGYL